jgi:hypothetical protein
MPHFPGVVPRKMRLSLLGGIHLSEEVVDHLAKCLGLVGEGPGRHQDLIGGGARAVRGAGDASDNL